MSRSKWIKCFGPFNYLCRYLTDQRKFESYSESGEYAIAKAKWKSFGKWFKVYNWISIRLKWPIKPHRNHYTIVLNIFCNYFRFLLFDLFLYGFLVDAEERMKKIREKNVKRATSSVRIIWWLMLQFQSIEERIEMSSEIYYIKSVIAIRRNARLYINLSSFHSLYCVHISMCMVFKCRLSIEVHL